MKKIQYRIEYLFYQILSMTIVLLPRKIIASLAVFFGLFLYYSGVRKKIIETNLNIAFGDTLNRKALKKIRKKTCINAAIVAFEFIYLKRLKLSQLKNYIKLSGLELLEEALQEEKGVIVAGNHFGNWELISGAISYFGTPMYMFTGMQKNLLIDNAINDIRRKFGTVTISKAKSAAFDMMRALKQNKPLGMAGDLNVPHDNLFVNFFGKKAVVGQGLATFALKRKAPLLFIWSVRESPFNYKGYLKRIDYQISGDQQQDLERLAQSISDELEDKIRQNPDQYFWFNRRWKTRPADDPDRVY
ncbi:MAG: lysophospholipid acyltransferase family protein [Proteobacteria bacterium]|nr:lysophospholipid acyltransferase family protein [Pseudomonadota bacterium]